MICKSRMCAGVDICARYFCLSCCCCRTTFLGNDKNAVTKSTQLVDDVDMMGDISGDVTRHSVKPEQVDNNQHENRNGQRQDPGRVIGIINDWISSVSFLKGTFSEQHKSNKSQTNQQQKTL